MTDKESPTPLLEKIEISSRHGCVVLGLWWVSYLLTFISVHYNLSRLARRFHGPNSPYDHEARKAKPWWQDIELLFALVLGSLALLLIFSCGGTAYWAGQLFSMLVLLDLINFHARALWFDDLRPPIPDAATSVWSHRRLLFHAAISFAASIFLFAGFYTLVDRFSGQDFFSLVRRSFRTAATFNLDKSYVFLEALQIGVSIFFLVVVIATVASSAYKRDELADARQDDAA